MGFRVCKGCGLRMWKQNLNQSSTVKTGSLTWPNHVMYEQLLQTDTMPRVRVPLVMYLCNPGTTTIDDTLKIQTSN